MVAIDLRGFGGCDNSIDASTSSLCNFALIGAVLLTFAACEAAFQAGALRMLSNKI